MNFRGTLVGKTWDLVSRYGVSAGLQESAARWARSRLGVPFDAVGDFTWILTKNNPARLPAPKAGHLRINWLLPQVGRGSGGELNIFRAIHFLEKWGHENRIYVQGRSSASGADAQALARSFYFPVKASIERFEGEVADSDALVATHWTTAYAARTIGNTAGKFYFVQDLEHRFYAEGSLAEFAKETYRWGFHGITLGNWIADSLRREFGMQCSPFGFSFDRDIYSANGGSHLQGEKKRVIFYARPQTEMRGFELGVLALSLVSRARPDIEFVLVGFPQRQIRIPFPAVFPGVLSPVELAALYRTAVVALVLSHTNVSLLPLELMACGCAVVSNVGPNVEWLLTDKTTQLAEPTPQSISDAILKLLGDHELRARKVDAALAFAQGTDWASEINKIELALLSGLNITGSNDVVER